VIPLGDHFKVIDTVLKGVMTGSYVAMQQFRAQGSGILINVASLLGKVPHTHHMLLQSMASWD
jgi:NADP-dependent 3-hydroxy acid dehydrogenase YdfG